MSKSEPLQSKDAEQMRREEAIDRYIKGEKPAAICRALGRSRPWFYRVLARYEQGGWPALTSRSRAPHRVHNRTPEEIEKAVVRVRQAITEGEDPDLRYANIGADMIISELKRVGLDSPSRATVNRILVRQGLVQPRPQGKAKRQLPDDYPWPDIQGPNDLHLFDFVLRAGAGMRRFYSAHLLDAWRRWPYLRLLEIKTADAVGEFLVAAWQELGLPGALYIDNDVVWRGSSSAARTFSRIVRLCLFLGVEAIFTPPYTPEANPIIESFNRVWDRNFWQRMQFTDLEHMSKELLHFQSYCRFRRPLAQFNGVPAAEVAPDFQPAQLSPRFQWPEHSLPLTAGFVHFIRFVDHEGCFSCLNESWQLHKDDWAHKTVRATIDTARQQLHVYHQERPQAPSVRIATFDYALRETVQPLLSCYRRPAPCLWPDSAS